jgi:hypothetical protein
VAADGAQSRRERTDRSRTRRRLKALLDATAGYKLDRGAELEAIVAVRGSGFPNDHEGRIAPSRCARTMICAPESLS